MRLSGKLSCSGGRSLSLHPAERHALDYAINNGHGSIWLHLTEQQYRKLTG
jgi:hypothetical protein